MPAMKIPEIPEYVAPFCVRTYEQVVNELRTLAASNPDVMKVEMIGTSAEGRDIPMAVVGTGEKKVMVQCRIHGAEVTSTEAMMDFLPELVKNRAYKGVLSGVTLLAIPMLSVDAADLYATTRHLLIGRLPEELLRLWQERAQKFPAYYQDLLDTFWGRNSRYGNRGTPHFYPMVSQYKDIVTGLTKYVCHFDEWLWIDAQELRIPGLLNPNRDNWQLTLPETRARFSATIKYKPDCFLDLHGYGAERAGVEKAPTATGDMTPDTYKDVQKVYQLFTFAASNPAWYYKDPDAGWKGTFLGERFSDPRYLRLSGLDLGRKSDRRYQFPSTTEDQMAEGLKVAKIVSQAAQDETGQASAPVGHFQWNGQAANPVYTDVAVACNPEFHAATLGCEVFGGAECGNIGLAECKPVYKAVISSVLKYYAGQGLPTGWEDFPVLQSPLEKITHSEYTKRRSEWDKSIRAVSR